MASHPKDYKLNTSHLLPLADMYVKPLIPHLHVLNLNTLLNTLQALK